MTQTPQISDEQVEAAAKALYEHDDAWSSAFPWPDLPDGPLSAIGYRVLALAALTAAAYIPASRGVATDDEDTDGRVQIIEQSDTLDGGYALTLELDGKDTAVVVHFAASPAPQPVQEPVTDTLGAFGTPTDIAFVAWRDAQPKEEWSKFDLSAAKLGFIAGVNAARQKP